MRSNVRSKEKERERQRCQTWRKRADVSLSVATFRDKDEGRIKVLDEIRPKDVGSFERSVGAIDGVSNGDVGARNDVKDENVGGSDEFPFVALSVIDVERSDIGRGRNPRKEVGKLSRVPQTAERSSGMSDRIEDVRSNM